LDGFADLVKLIATPMGMIMLSPTQDITILQETKGL